MDKVSFGWRGEKEDEMMGEPYYKQVSLKNENHQLRQIFKTDVKNEKSKTIEKWELI